MPCPSVKFRWRPVSPRPCVASWTCIRTGADIWTHVPPVAILRRDCHLRRLLLDTLEPSERHLAGSSSVVARSRWIYRVATASPLIGNRRTTTCGRGHPLLPSARRSGAGPLFCGTVHGSCRSAKILQNPRISFLRGAFSVRNLASDRAFAGRSISPPSAPGIEPSTSRLPGRFGRRCIRRTTGRHWTVRGAARHSARSERSPHLLLHNTTERRTEPLRETPFVTLRAARPLRGCRGRPLCSFHPWPRSSRSHPGC